MKQESWKSYEEVAEYLLNQFAQVFGLGKVEGKQIIAGESGTNWEIDAKGLKKGGDGFVIVECRRYAGSKLNQEKVAGVAYRIHDTGAAGGIIVSPLELQSGAKKVADHENIQHVTLDSNSTTTEYLLKFLNLVFVGLKDNVFLNDSISIKLIRDGKVIDER